MTPAQYQRAATYMETGRHGSFAACIGSAYFAADHINRARLLAAFSEIFATAYQFHHPKMEIVTNE
jgi:hypothetical protein